MTLEITSYSIQPTITSFVYSRFYTVNVNMRSKFKRYNSRTGSEMVGFFTVEMEMVGFFTFKMGIVGFFKFEME